MVPSNTMRHTARFIDLHQDMLYGVAQLEGGFPVYGSSYLTGAHHAAAVWSSLYPHTPGTTLLDELEAHAELLRSHSTSLRLVSTRDDLDSDDPRTGVLPHSEGLQLPSVEPDMLEVLWSQYSLRSLSLTWNHETAYGSSCYDDPGMPLSAAGRALLGAMQRSPLFLDLAHLNQAGFCEALDIYEPPVLVTHSFCRQIVDHPRGLTDDQLRAVGEHGGLVGLAFPPDFLGERGSVDEALMHIERIAALAGEEAVSIGSDWGVAAMGELADPAALVSLLDAVGTTYGPGLAERFAFANAHDFLRDQLPTAADGLELEAS
ncbi:MAG: membrane dipeptidase [Coriobacteriia bacterium]|nr:membrane dipeptidase [Coriobacteriia bacterium]